MRTFLLYGHIRLVLVAITSIMVMIAVFYYYYTWNPPGLEELITRLKIMGLQVDPKDPATLLESVTQVEPEMTKSIKEIVIMAPYDSTEPELAVIVSGLGIMMHSLVLLLSVLYASVFHEVLTTGVYGIISSIKRSRTWLYRKLFLNSMAIFLVFLFLATFPLLLSHPFNKWIGYRGFRPLMLVWITMFISLLVELLFYMALGSLMAYYGYFIEYAVTAVFMLLVFPLVTVGVLSPVLKSQIIVSGLFTIMIILRPLHATPGLVVGILKYTSWDSVAAPFLHWTSEASYSIIGLMLSIIITLVLVYQTHSLFKWRGIP